METKIGKNNFFENSIINLDKMIFKFIDESELRELLSKRKIKFDVENIFKIREKILEQHKEIKIKVEKRLSQLLPNFEAKKIEVLFTSYEWADFRCLDDKEIVVDLVRLSKNLSFIETLIDGITHEVFHVWFNYNYKLFIEKNNLKHKTIDNNKFKILLHSLNEGFAVKISGQDLENFYKIRLNKEYNVTFAFDKFNDFLKNSDEKEIKKAEEEGFQKMGFFYVVSYEIIKAIISYNKVDFIKKVFSELNFLKIFQKYKEICELDDTLPKIDFIALEKIFK